MVHFEVLYFLLFVSDLQESFIESLVGFVCHKDSLKALEELPLERCAIIRNYVINFILCISRKKLLLTIMDTFSKNSWISSAGLLARFWKVVIINSLFLYLAIIKSS